MAANDFVDLKHAADNKSTALYLTEILLRIVYISGNNTDFSAVGVSC